MVVFVGTRCVILTPNDNQGCLLLDRRSVKGLSSLFELPLSYFSKDFTRTAALAQAYAGPDTFVTWHRRLGHLNPVKMRQILKGVLTAKQCDEACACHACLAAKIHHTVFPKTSAFTAKFPGHSTSLDFAGPFRTRSPFGQRYFCLFIDVHSRFKSIRLAKTKDELDTFVLEHIALVERLQQPARVCTLISDGALCSNFIRAKLRAMGVTVLIIAPGASRLNLVERGNRSIAEGARAMNDTAGLPPSLFLQACVAMVAIDNRVYKQTTVCAPDGRPLSPLEIYDHRVRSSSKELFATLRVYGCLCFSLQHSNKQITKAERCVMLGPAPDNPKAYLLMSLERRRYFISRDIVAEETSFPFKKAFTICPVVHETSRDDDVNDDELPKTVEGIQPLNDSQFDNFLVHEEAVAPTDGAEPEEVQAPSPVITPDAPTIDDAPQVSASLIDLFSKIDTTDSDPPITRSQVAVSENAERANLGTGDKAAHRPHLKSVRFTSRLTTVSRSESSRTTLMATFKSPSPRIRTCANSRWTNRR